jgi:hypothetical protein
MFVFSKSPFYNKKYSDYCKQTTMESIRRIVENNKNKYQLVSTFPVPPPNFNNFLIFLSVSSMFFFFFINKKLTL